ncbi:hypothetical protein AB0D57_03770 [Streptomyces sp. NPDC048275]
MPGSLVGGESEAFLTGRRSGLPCVLRLESHLTMKKIKARS